MLQRNARQLESRVRNRLLIRFRLNVLVAPESPFWVSCTLSCAVNGPVFKQHFRSFVGLLGRQPHFQSSGNRWAVCCFVCVNSVIRSGYFGLFCFYLLGQVLMVSVLFLLPAGGQQHFDGCLGQECLFPPLLIPDDPKIRRS